MSELEAALTDEVKALKAENERLAGVIRFLKRDLFGSKSERYEEIAGQMIFNEIEKEASNIKPSETEKISYERKKGRGKKKPFPEGLAREEQIIDLKPEDKICPEDGRPLKLIGEVRLEKLKIIPAQMSIVVEIKKKYGCDTCDSITQPKTNSILPGTIATPELLSYIAFSKFYQGLPLYRIEELSKLHGVDLKRGTMARWMIKVSEQLMPIRNILQDWAFESGYVAIDATSVQVLKEPGRRPQAKSHMWARGSPERGIVLFDYDVSGAGRVAKHLLEGFKGAVQADAHPAYGVLDEQKVILGCLMHARRRFEKAWKEGQKKPGLAADALEMFRFLYRKEESYKDQGLTPERRKYFRDQEIAPSMKAIKDWADLNVMKVLKSSPIGDAIHYYINEYEALTAFLSDGRYEMDNGWIERVIRKFAIGRNNWLFCDTVDGANASSILYSLVITAKLNRKDPFKVLTEIFNELPHANTADDYEKLAGLLLSPADPLSCHKKDG
jgi:transposase